MYKQLIIVSIFILCCVTSVNAANPIAYYKFMDTGPHGDNLDAIYDYTGNGHIGQSYNVSGYNPGVQDTSLCFIGSYSYVSVPDDTVFSFTNGATDYDYSISMWVNSPDYNNTVLLSKGHFTIDHEYSCYAASSGRLVFYMKDSSYLHGAFKYGKTREPITDYTDEWLNIVITHGPLEVINIFVNGEKMDTDEFIGPNYTSMQNGNDDLTIGQVNTFSNAVCMDEIIIWDSYLNDNEVLELYQEYKNDTYNLIFLPSNPTLKNTNYSVYENDIYIGEYQYGDNVPIRNMRDYKIILHEDITDSIAHIENIGILSQGYITYLIYVIIIAGVIALVLKFYRKF